MRSFVLASILLAAAPCTLSISGCSTAPKAEDQTAFRAEADAARLWFENHVPGLREQINASSAYIIYPSVGQWGIIFGGGQFGRGAVERPDGKLVGWGAINVASLGLQAGARGFKMLVVIQDENTLHRFRSNQLSGSISGVAVVAESGTSGTTPFQQGFAIYQGSSQGLMAGVNIGLDYMRFQPVEAGN